MATSHTMLHSVIHKQKETKSNIIALMWLILSLMKPKSAKTFYWNLIGEASSTDYIVVTH
jgi:hypothetical protein